MPNDKDWTNCFEEWHAAHHPPDDASHDLNHFRRVAKLSKIIAGQIDVKSDLNVLIAAAYFHDIVNLPKDHPQRSQASSLSAGFAEKILDELGFPQDKIASVAHAIEAHSFSANIEPVSLEAKIIQDADRMEALGAIGVLRAIYVSGKLDRPLFHTDDPFAIDRPLDDQKYGLDHFKMKVTHLPGLLKTPPGRKMAKCRIDVVKRFTDSLVDEISESSPGDMAFICDHFFKAGQGGLYLFHPEDPFAKERVKEGELYALDNLTTRETLDWFLSHLADELSI